MSKKKVKFNKQQLDLTNFTHLLAALFYIWRFENGSINIRESIPSFLHLSTAVVIPEALQPDRINMKLKRHEIKTIFQIRLKPLN